MGLATYKNPPPGNTMDNPTVRAVCPPTAKTRMAATNWNVHSTATSRSSNLRLTGPSRGGCVGSSMIGGPSGEGCERCMDSETVILLRSLR